MTSPTIQLGNSTIIRDASYVARWRIDYAADATINVVRLNSSGVEQETVLSLSPTDGSLTSITAGNSAAVIEAANDVVPTILGSTRSIILADSTTGNKAILTDTSGDNQVLAGQMVHIRLVACTGNSYTLALVTGTLTFNAAGEQATIVRNSANTGWLVAFLGTATVV